MKNNLMKRLIIVRHGKAESKFYPVKDFDRELTDQGKKDAKEMAVRFLLKQIIPDQWLSSPASRTLETAMIFANEFQVKLSDIQQEKNIYEASIRDLLHVINAASDSSASMILFGHNPSASDIVEYLTGSTGYTLPTSGVAVISFSTNVWKEISKETGSLEWLAFPDSATLD